VVSKYFTHWGFEEIKLVKMYYFDNAATSWPKPGSVMKVMQRYFFYGGGNPGRSGHRKAIEAGKTVLNTRQLLASLFNIKDPSSIVFTKNATEALNIAIVGSLKPGDHVVTTSMEHNSVMRPLRHLEDGGVRISVAKTDSKGRTAVRAIEREVEDSTKLIAVTHASNVTGTINDIEAIGNFCRKRNIRFLVDAAQTVGVVPIDVEKINADLLAFSGHKGLLGPQGTGGLYVKNADLSDPLMRGGTGSLSDREDQPDFMPDRYESGTLNVIGIAGLGESVRWVIDRGVERIMEHDSQLLEIFVNELSENERFKLYGLGKAYEQTGVVSINIKGLSPSRVGEVLDRKYGILTRIGLHCAPQAHKTLGTFPDGTVRFSWGVFTKQKDIVDATHALREIAEGS